MVLNTLSFIDSPVRRNKITLLYINPILSLGSKYRDLERVLSP